MNEITVYSSRKKKVLELEIFFKYFRKTTTQRILSRSSVLSLLCQNTVLSHIETPREIFVVYTVWKFGYFPANQILREINCEFGVAKIDFT